MWQKTNLPDRLYQMAGQESFLPPHGAVTLNHTLPYAGFWEDIRLRDAMDPRMEPYCYTYLD